MEPSELPGHLTLDAVAVTESSILLLIIKTKYMIKMNNIYLSKQGQHH